MCSVRRLSVGRRLRVMLAPRAALRKPSVDERASQNVIEGVVKDAVARRLAVVAAGRGSGRSAAILLAGVALSLARAGERVVMVDLTEGHPLQRMFRGRHRDAGVRTVSLAGTRVRLALASPTATGVVQAAVTEDADAVLVLASADPSLGAEPLARWVSTAVVAVRAGGASDVLVEAAGEMLRAAGLLVVGGVLIDAESQDETVGMARGANALRPGRAGDNGAIASEAMAAGAQRP